VRKEEIERKLDRMGAALKSKRVAVLTHNNPDPDCIASAFGLCLLLKRRFRVDSSIFYAGLIARAENRAMVGNLHIPLLHVREMDRGLWRSLALVDTQPGAGNNECPAKVIPLIVIDHHKPIRKKTLASPFHDIRTECGSSSTIVTGYLQAAGVDIPRNVATALFYGIKTDTYGLGRDTIPDDIEAYRSLMERIDPRKIGRIEKPGHRRSYFAQMHTALEGVEIFEDAAVTVLWKAEYPEFAAEVADWLSSMHGIRWVLVLGVHDCKLYLSVRTKERKRDAGHVIRSVVGRHGMAGGHNQIAGGMVEIPGCGNAEIRAEVERIKTRFFRIVAKKEQIDTAPLIVHAKQTGKTT
jgi:nanoRNase/pAp phosphatase (c-di-AMP/oligoRNAs hydrolase)